MNRPVRWRLDRAKVRVRQSTHRLSPATGQRQGEPAIEQRHDEHPDEEDDKP